MSVLPFGVGLFIIVQLVMLGLKISLPAAFSFGGNGIIIWAPMHLLFLRLSAFLFFTEQRTVAEKTNTMKGKQDDNQYAMLNAPFLEVEQSKNRLFAMKMAVIYLVFLWESIRESLTRYTISVWSTFGIAIAITLMFAMEGLTYGVMWWPDQRKITSNMIEELEEK